MSRRALFLLCALGLLLMVPLQAAPLGQWTLTESLGYAWTRELISYPLPAALKLAPGQERGYIVRDDAGAALPFQFYADPVQPAKVSLLLLVDLPPYATRTFTLEKGKNSAVNPTDLALKREGDNYLATFGRAAARLAGPVKAKPGTPFAQLPAPIQTVKGVSGAWLGEGRLAGTMPVMKYECVVEANGPLVAQVRMRYNFSPRKFYQARVRMIAGEAVLLVEEDYALSEEEVKQINFAKPPDLAPEIGTPSNYSDWLVTKHIGWFNIPIEVDKYPCFRFNFTKGLANPRVRGYGIGQAKAIYGKADFAAAKDDWRLGLLLTPYQERGRRGGTIGFDTADGKDYLGLFYRFGSRWVHPNESRVLLPWLDEGIVGHFIAFEGRREWGLLLAETGPQHDEVSQKSTGRKFAMLQRVSVKFGETPLDKVKGWTLRWPLPAAAHFPRVFYSPESLARMKEAFPGLSDEVKKLLRSDMEAFAFLTGDQAQLKQAYTGHLASLRTSAYDFLDGGHNTMNTYTHRFQEILRGSARALDIALSCPNLTPEERERALAVVAFLAYKQSDPDYWPYRAYGGGPSNPNMMSIACSALATGSAMLAGHPQQRDWLELCRRLVSADIMSSISKDGAWLESPGYQGAGNTPINETVLILRNAGVVNLTADPVYGKRLQDVSTYFANLLTPPDPRFNGQRKPMALGDNTPFWNNHYAYIAHGGRDAFPTQAGNAIWAWQQMGQPIGSVGLMLLQEHVLDGSLQPVPISGKSVAIDGFGVMLRHGFDTPAESFLTYRHNDFGYGHYDEDQGSFSWFAKGMPLCTDWIDYSFQEAEYHNRVTYEQGEPAWLLAPLDQTVFTPEADYVRGHDADPMRWQRQLLFVKDAKNPGDATYLVVRDLIRTDAPTTWNVWTLAVHGSEKVEGNVAHFTGQYGVDLAITFTRPLAKPLTTLLKQHTTRSYITMKQDMTRVQASADKGGDYGVVLYPTRRGKDAEPTVRELPSGVVEVRWNDARRHLIFLFPDVREVTEAGITLKGRAAIAKIENGKTTLVPLECEIFTTK